jgi:hypothetical protein
MNQTAKHDLHCDCGICAYCNGQEDIYGNRKSDATIRQAQPQGGELLPCRFCPDSKGETRQTQRYIHPGGIETDCPLYAVICDTCGARGPEEDTPHGAEQGWNTRADLPRATADNRSDDWCDDCHAYSHLPFCPAYRTRNDPPVDRLVDAVYRSMQQYEDGTWLLDNLRAKARVRRILESRANGETTVEAAQVPLVRQLALRLDRIYGSDLTEQMVAATADLPSVSEDTEDSDLEFVVDAIFRAAHGAERGSTNGLQAAVIGYAERLKQRGWTWDAEQTPTVVRAATRTKGKGEKL